MKIESEIHYWNIVKKMMSERNLSDDLTTQFMQFLRETCNWLYPTIASKDLFRVCGMRTPGECFTFKLKDIKQYDIDALNIVVGSFCDFKADINKFIKTNGRCCTNEVKFLLSFEEKRIFYSSEYNKPAITNEFMALAESLIGRYGVYLFYDKFDTLCYVGKSINLGHRIVSSFTERLPIPVKVKIIIPESIADIHIIEPYLVLKERPRLNAEFSSDQETSFKLKIPNPAFEAIITKEHYERIYTTQNTLA